MEKTGVLGPAANWQNLSHDVYSTFLYDPKSYIGKTTYIWLCWLHLVLPSTCHSMLCCEL